MWRESAVLAILASQHKKTMGIGPSEGLEPSTWRAITVGPRCAYTLVRLDSDLSQNCHLAKPFGEAPFPGFFELMSN